jgi:hypothetical protein
MVKVTWNAREWVDTGAELRRWKNMDVPTFVRHRARVATQDLLKWTPPRGKHPSKESFNEQKKRGQKTLERDIRRVFFALDQAKIITAPENEKLANDLKRYIASGNTGAIERILRNLRIPFKSLHKLPYPSLHEAARDRRGNVRKAQGHLVLRDASIKKYIRQRQPMIGEFKAGWNAAARALGVPSRHWPAWVSGQKVGAAPVVDRLKNVSRPTLTLVNASKWINSGDQERFVDAVLAINQIKMQKELRAIKNWNDFKRGRGITRPTTG